MKKKLLTLITSAFLSASLNAQIITNTDFSGSLGDLGTPGVAAPWVKGCANNDGYSDMSNTPRVLLNGGQQVLELSGSYDPSQSGSIFNLETAEQYLGAIPSGIYTVVINAKFQAQTTGNPGIRLAVRLKGYTGCGFNLTDPKQLTEIVSLTNNFVYNTYTVTFCVPPSLHNLLNYIEIGTIQQDDTSIFCNGLIYVDSISMENTSEPFTTHFEYQINCATGQIQVRPTTAMNPNLSDVYIVVENNPNDPNNLDEIGDVQHTSAWFNYSSNIQDWYTIPLAIQPGKNYYIKRGVWGSCMIWNEHREYNVELQPNQFDASFTLDVSCNAQAEPILSVTGANQGGKKPNHMFTLYKYFPGTNNPDQFIETVDLAQIPNPFDQYIAGPFSFSHVLDPTDYYYVKRGVWDACTPWNETRQYDIHGVICPKNGNVEMPLTEDQNLKEIHIYPNPGKDVITIETNRELDEIQLYSIGGKLIDTFKSTTISVEGLESGTYLFKILKDGIVQSTERFVKE